MLINRDDQFYMDIDTIDNHSIQYQVFLYAMRQRYFYPKVPKNNHNDFIDYCNIKKKLNISSSHDRDAFTMECKDIFPDETHYFIKDYAYYNNPNYQLWVNIDFSLPKEMLIAQISQLKDDVDNNEIELPNLKKEDTIKFLPSSPTQFAKIIKRQYGDFLFMFDSKELGYKNQDII